tara:strand:- start:209 stop:490 length:282 start_codon:yes stop_codon:yes gene_type:complete
VVVEVVHKVLLLGQMEVLVVAEVSLEVLVVLFQTMVMLHNPLKVEILELMALVIMVVLEMTTLMEVVVAVALVLLVNQTPHVMVVLVRICLDL